MSSRRLTCTVNSELFDEIAESIKEGVWSTQAAFVRDAIEHSMFRQRIRRQLSQKGISNEQQNDYPESLEELWILLQYTHNEILQLRQRTITEKSFLSLLETVTAYRKRIEFLERVAEALDAPVEAIELLQSLTSKDYSEENPFHEAELAINMLLEYYKSPMFHLPKTDIETWREVSKTASWQHRIHGAMTRIANTLEKTSKALALMH